LSIARERLSWHSVFQPLIAAVLLLVFTFGAIRLHRGWKSILHKQTTVAAKGKYVPPVDPALAKDPSVQAAKMKVIGPLASQVQVPEDSPDLTSADTAPPEAAASATPANVDLVRGFRQLPPLHLFHGRLSVQGYRDLQFEIPPHASFPRVAGSYKQLGNGRSRNAGLLLLSDEQFREFIHGNLGDAVFSNDGSSGTIDVALSPTRVSSQKYHLLLRASPAVTVPMEADFTVSFD
jgi:hypothetical protein